MRCAFVAGSPSARTGATAAARTKPNSARLNFLLIQVIQALRVAACPWRNFSKRARYPGLSGLKTEAYQTIAEARNFKGVTHRMPAVSTRRGLIGIRKQGRRWSRPSAPGRVFPARH